MNPSDFDNVTPELWSKNEEEYKGQLEKMSSWKQIPLINSNPLHRLSDGKLVRFRGMIQDMHNPEFYFESFEVVDSATNEVNVKSGKYRDMAYIKENEKINYTSNLKSGQRQTMVVISMPGINNWAQTIENNDNRLQSLEIMDQRKLLQSMLEIESHGSSDNANKRTIHDANKEDKNIDESVDVKESEQKSKERKTSEKSESNSENKLSKQHILNFPIPDVPSKSCLLKVYEEDDSLKLNEMVEIVGFLSVDPALNAEFTARDSEMAGDESLQDETSAEILTHNPPPSLVPRLHAVYVKKLRHCNPLVQVAIDQDQISKEASIAREHLEKTLTELLLGDKLAAEYLICHLISCVYLRQDTITLGQFALNISNVPVEKCPDFTKQVYNFIQQFVTKSVYLPLTLENLNTMAFLPKKDYECNRLTSGLLQLSKGTHLVLDETKMEQGRLDATGVSNLKALGHLITMQKVEYQFKFYQMEFETDVPVLVMSEGASLLPCLIQLPLKPDPKSMEIFKEITEAATHYLKPEILNVIRSYLTNIKQVDYTIDEDLQFVQEDFIEMRNRKDGLEPPSADDLHRLLVLARLVSLSRGYNTLNKECWEITKKMEDERAYRVKNRLNL